MIKLVLVPRDSSLYPSCSGAADFDYQEIGTGWISHFMLQRLFIQQLEYLRDVLFPAIRRRKRLTKEILSRHFAGTIDTSVYRGCESGIWVNPLK